MTQIRIQKPLYIFELEFEVRDYECDLQGVVNNAVYLHYLEHTRHKFFKAVGLDFAALHEEGIDAFVARANLEYKHPLRSGDRFVCRLWIEKKGRLRYIFHQDIYRLPDELLIAKAEITGTTTVNGKLGVCEKVDRAFQRAMANEKIPSNP